MTTQSPTTRFSSRVSSYTRARPSYPDSALDALLAAHRTLHPDIPHPLIADLGAGTGIASLQLANLSCTILAVEPNPDMRAAIQPHPLITPIDATAESTTLPSSSVDIALAAQAFHWFNPDDAIREFHRILKPRSLAALLWNSKHPDDPATSAYYDAVKRHATEPPSSPWASATADPIKAARPLADSPLFTNFRYQRFSNSQSLPRELFIERAMSASYSPTHGPAHAALIRDLHAIFDQHAVNDAFTFQYLTELHTAERAS